MFSIYKTSSIPTENKIIKFFTAKSTANKYLKELANKKRKAGYKVTEEDECVAYDSKTDYYLYRVVKG